MIEKVIIALDILALITVFIIDVVGIVLSDRNTRTIWTAVIFGMSLAGFILWAIIIMYSIWVTINVGISGRSLNSCACLSDTVRLFVIGLSISMTWLHHYSYFISSMNSIIVSVFFTTIIAVLSIFFIFFRQCISFGNSETTTPDESASELEDYSEFKTQSELQTQSDCHSQSQFQLQFQPTGTCIYLPSTTLTENNYIPMHVYTKPTDIEPTYYKNGHPYRTY